MVAVTSLCHRRDGDCGCSRRWGDLLCGRLEATGQRCCDSRSHRFRSVQPAAGGERAHQDAGIRSWMVDASTARHCQLLQDGCITCLNGAPLARRGRVRRRSLLRYSTRRFGAIKGGNSWFLSDLVRLQRHVLGSQWLPRCVSLSFLWPLRVQLDQVRTRVRTKWNHPLPRKMSRQRRLRK
jgi:hypothetical protein